MHNYEDLLAKSKEWRDWYYDGAPTPNPVTESVSDAFDLINATLFGHIYQRESLPGNIRSICTVAALIALDKPNQLPGHITGALNYGWTKEQIVELITPTPQKFSLQQLCGKIGLYHDLQNATTRGYPMPTRALNAAEQAWTRTTTSATPDD